MSVDVEPAKGTEGAGGKEPVGGIDVVQVIHETEWSVGQDIAIALQPGDGLGSEAPDVVRAGLDITVKVLGVIVCI